MRKFQAHDLKARLLTACLLAPVALLAVYFGGLPFAILIALVAGLHNWEWNRVFKRGAEWVCSLAPALTVATVLVFAVWGWNITQYFAAASFILLFFSNPLKKPAAAFGYLYSAGWAICAVAFRGSDGYGLVVVLFLLMLVWGFDIAGYFFGKAFGGPKLLPSVSPNKTWSGFLGGLFVSALVCLGLGVLHSEIHPVSILFVGLAAVLAAQAGDLFESAVKRHLKVKDSSQLLPGHGGLMDRIDGLILAVLISALIAGLNGAEETMARALLFYGG